MLLVIVKETFAEDLLDLCVGHITIYYLLQNNWEKCPTKGQTDSSDETNDKNQ
jgi:hypothetical protein